MPVAVGPLRRDVAEMGGRGLDRSGEDRRVISEDVVGRRRANEARPSGDEVAIGRLGVGGEDDRNRIEQGTEAPRRGVETGRGPVETGEGRAGGAGVRALQERVPRGDVAIAIDAGRLLVDLVEDSPPFVHGRAVRCREDRRCVQAA